jgi:hypothetical protein
MFVNDEHSSLLLMEPYSKHFISFVYYEWSQKARVLQYNRLQSLASNQQSGLLGPFVSYREDNVF